MVNWCSPCLRAMFSPLSPHRPKENTIYMTCGSEGYFGRSGAPWRTRSSRLTVLTAAGLCPDADQVVEASRSPTVPDNVTGSAHTPGSPEESLVSPSNRWWNVPQIGDEGSLMQGEVSAQSAKLRNGTTQAPSEVQCFNDLQGPGSTQQRRKRREE
jgi:hypothetical protein